MSLGHAILGILQLEPMTGYDLKTHYFDQSIRYFWPADQAQIYRTLDKMEESGWIRSEIEVQTGRPNRKVYQITQSGRQELRRWLSEPEHLLTFRDPFLIQIFFAGQLPDEDIFGLIEQHIAHHQSMLDQYASIDLPPLEELRDKRHHTMGRLTLEYGLRFQQMYLDWLKLARDTIRSLDPEAKK